MFLKCSVCDRISEATTRNRDASLGAEITGLAQTWRQAWSGTSPYRAYRRQRQCCDWLILQYAPTFILQLRPRNFHPSILLASGAKLVLILPISQCYS